MNRSLVLSAIPLFFSMFITACGGGGGGNGGNRTVRTGVFIDGPVKGLSYETPTQSGLTNEHGEFGYMNGETVTFSIGGIELGSAKGAAEISPFDLAGVAPPTTELALRLELNTRNDITAFDRAANIAFLLVSLDNDADPDNGIDITGWDADLAGVDLNLEANLYKFARKFRRFAAVHGINPNVTPMRPLAHLYQSLGITVPIHLLDYIEHDTDNNGTPDIVVDYTFSSRGQLNRRTIDEEVNGIFDEIKSYTYTADGRLASQSIKADYDEDGVTDYMESFVNTYNSDGDISSAVAEYGSAAPSIKSVIASSYNEFGDLVLWIQNADTDLDDVTDSILKIAYTYDSDGNLLKRVLESDSDPGAVGVDDKMIDTFTYDASGNFLTWHLDDYGDDDVVDFSSHQVNSYDSAGNVLSTVRAQDDDGAGPGTTGYNVSFTNTYDSRGNLLVSVREEGNGVSLGSRTRTTNTYNSDGTLMLSSFQESDSDLDGLYDRKNLKSTYTYDAYGNWVTQLHKIDTDGDGGFDSASRSVHHSTVLNDGMFGLLFHYLNTSLVNN